jgi:hypothetical protein
MNDTPINPELGQVEVHGMNRSTFLVRGAIATGGLYGAGAVGQFVTRAFAQGGGDVDILNFALTLEYLEAAFYAEAVAKGKLSGETARFAKVVANHEAAHVKILKTVLGAKAISEPTFDFKDTVTNQTKFLATADVLENTGVHAYLGQVGNIKPKKILGAAGSILPIEARHAVVLGEALDLDLAAYLPTFEPTTGGATPAQYPVEGA